MRKISCSAKYFLNQESKKLRVFENGIPLLKVESPLGPEGINEMAMDLLDIGILVYFIERNLPGKLQMNKVLSIDVSMGLRKPSVWSPEATQALEDLLLFMGGTHWHFDFSLDKDLEDHKFSTKNDSSIHRVSLFSGGLDSLCGAATIRNTNDVRLVSFYTKQKSLQRKLAGELGMETPIQWGWNSKFPLGRTRNFRYRSFLFMCIAAVTSHSFRSTRILQFENGILASGVAPSLSLQTTKHAHYHMHRLCEVIFNKVLGGNWIIENPFENKTKREAFLDMAAELGNERAISLANMTETCWNLNAGLKRIQGNTELKKRNNIPCGFCVPCIIRQTALPQKAWVDLHEDEIRNHPLFGRYFREYYGMVQRIQSVRNKSLGEFCMAMDTFLQDALSPIGGYSLADLKSLFVHFADEFLGTFIN
jgi:7-cyano-7-deazaguanine synthase in queuosine biosynthesis